MIHENSHTNANVIHLVGSQRRNGAGAPAIFENTQRDKEDLGAEVMFQEAAKSSCRYSVQVQQERGNRSVESANSVHVHLVGDKRRGRAYLL
jgi:hypothetical protein